MVTDQEITSGVCDDGIRAFVSGVNCMHCGRFVGRDGSIEIETYEMSSTVASVEGECRRCIDRMNTLVPLVAGALQSAQDYGSPLGWLTVLNIRNIIENLGNGTYSVDEIQRSTWRIGHTKVERGRRFGMLAYRWVVESSRKAASDE